MPTKSSICKSADSIGLLIQRSVFSPISTPSSILFSSCCNWFANGEPIERHCPNRGSA